MASMNQVPRLSALTAIRKVGRPPSGTGSALASAGRSRRNSASSMPTNSACRHSRAPTSVATQGWPRTMRTVPTRSSSSLTRCDTADGVMNSARAARSKLPSRTTAATAAISAWSTTPCLSSALAGLILL